MVQAAQGVSVAGVVHDAEEVYPQLGLCRLLKMYPVVVGADISAVAGFVDNCWVCRQLLGL